MTAPSLLLDQNLSYKPKRLVESEFPRCIHVSDVGLAGERDESVWRFARAEGHALVSKDDDFRALALLHGAPPKILWLRLGNAGTAAIARTPMVWSPAAAPIACRAIG